MSKDEQAVLTAQTLSSEMIQNHNYHKGLHLAIQILPTFTVTCVQHVNTNALITVAVATILLYRLYYFYQTTTQTNLFPSRDLHAESDDHLTK